MGTELPGENEIFNAAAELTDPAQRAAFLDEVCADNTRLREEIEDLLKRELGAGSFLEFPLPSLEVTDIIPAITEKPGTQIGPYKLLQQIGEGGMGDVYMAEQIKPFRRKIALKIIKPGMDTKDVVARFEAERQALALMDHPNIARVLDAGATDSGRPYFAMELVRGVPVTDYCDKNNTSLDQRLKLFVTICHAVQHAHQKGVIHRDIKPNNIMVTLHDGKPVPKVIDFGVAKAISQQLTEKTLFTAYGQLVGTPTYMSPEQAETSGLDIDTRSDIFALGVLLYELLTGRPPFDAKELQSAGYVEMLRIIREQEPLKPSTRLSTMGDELTVVSNHRSVEPPKLTQLVQGDLDWIVMKALEKDRTRRYETANAFARDIQRHLRDEPVEACPPSAGYRLRKFSRKHKVPIITAGGITAVLLLSTVISAYLAIWARQAEQLAQDRLFSERQASREANDQRALADKQRDRAKRLNQSLQRQLQATLKARNETQRQAALVFLEKGLNLCEQGSVDEGMLWLASSLRQTANANATDLERSIRLQMAGWSRELHRLSSVLPHQGTVLAVAFSPDGKTVLTGSFDGKARLWDVATGELLSAPLQHKQAVWMVAFGADVNTVLTSGYTGTVRVWETATGKPIGLPLLSGKATDAAVVLSPNGKTIVTGTQDERTGKGHAQLWDSATGEPIGPPLEHQALVSAAAFSFDGSTVLTGSHDRTARLWDATTGKPAGPPLRDESLVQAVAFSPDGKTVVTGNYDGDVRLWEVATGKPLGLSLTHQGGIHSVAFSPDSKTVLTGSADHTARLWDVTSARQIGDPLQHADAVAAVTFSPDGEKILTGSWDGTARLWDLARTPDASPPLRHQKAVNAVAFSPDGETVLTGSSDRTARLWKRGMDRPKGPALKHDDVVYGVAFSPDGKTVLTGSWDKTVRMWEVTTGKPVGPPLQHQDAVWTVAYSPDGRTVLTGCNDSTAWLWDVSTGKAAGPPLRHQSGIQAAAFSPDGKTILTGSFDHTARLWNVQTGKPVGLDKPANLPDVLRRRLELAGGQPIGVYLQHQEAVRSVAFSPDGKHVVTGSGNQRTRGRTASTFPATRPGLGGSW